ncbi:MAG TPA: sodium:calcium antiporter [Actinomycetes bacterium]|nr:sodium:calcium antiporter [Actinomycetes bacterium]
MLGWLLLVAAAVLLVGGAELFVENAAGAARRLGVTVIAVGVLLAGAEPEELLTAVIAAVQDRPGLAVGDAVGANVTMLTACLGLAALVRPLTLGRRVRQYAALSAVAGVLAVAVLLDGTVSRTEGALLVLAYAGLVGLVWWREKEPPALGELAEVAEEQPVARAPATALVLALLGVAVMLVGGDLAVRGAVRVVDSLGSTDSAVGLTVLALATTAEMFALVLAAARHAVPEIAVAGVVGSAAYNATATLGAAAVARPLLAEGVLAAAVTAAALPLGILLLARTARLGRIAGAGLCAGYLGYVGVVLSG